MQALQVPDDAALIALADLPETRGLAEPARREA